MYRLTTHRRVFAAVLMTLSFASVLCAQIRSLQSAEAAPTDFSRGLSELQMEPSRRLELENALAQRNYKRVESILVEEAEHEPKSTHAAKALVLAGGVFFLDGQYLNSAIAWKKAEAIAPLDERSRFTLAMAYIKLKHGDWARTELQKLVTDEPQNPLYLYWLARLDYDSREYTAAIARLQKVVELDPKMMRGYDTLGLCYDYLGQFDEAIKYYDHAIELNRLQPHPSPWPHVNLGVSLIATNQLAEAEKNLRAALRYDPRLPQAHYQLGRVLEMQGLYDAALQSLNQAAALDPAYAEPHYLLGRIYHRLGNDALSKTEIGRFQELKNASERQSVAEFPQKKM
jgi:tetratricopeptide (TPR) repeat protein